MPETDNLLKKQEVADRLHVSTRTVERYLRLGLLKGVRLSPRTTRITAESVENYLRDCAA